ncbi:YggT family protein [Marinomonas sp. M1K-6]|uniref:YggT family protein n=1 Tax=Marinomonas profundi TaxID=2726122 RepID=A0A847QXR4_9GAMM|nr:YggT family protein [Marinomonas profundi]NLQ17369.1 YggT family protein [Marinomonas profundi]UDV01895.1 YggT family protein [Marinomonas profundi]
MNSSPLIMLVKVLCNLYLFVVLLRLVLQLTRADFYNPVSQGIVKATSPFVLPLRKIIPSIGRLDTATLVLAFVVQLLTVFLVVFLQNAAMPPVGYAIYTVAGTLYHLLDLYFWAMLISVILSWVAPGASHPGALLVGQITAPLYRLCQRFIPPLGGLDLSPIFIFLAISFLKQVLAPYSI